tara:strand:- start:19 stop:756 length:738 start_codon:yes stop_codon:yes gene_type:complete
MGKKLDSFISKLDSLNTSELVDVFVPSIQKEVSFKLFSVGQQKDLIRTALTGIVGAIKCGVIYNDIITNNCQEDIEFSYEDKNAILIALRKASISNDITIDGITYNLNELPTKLPKFKNQTKNIKFSDFELALKVPSLKLDKAITEKALLDISKLSEEKKKSESVDILLTYEIVKYLDSIKGKDNDFDLTELTVYEKKRIVENLPLKVNNKIIEFIASVTEYSNQYVTFKDNTVVEFDAGFLTRE